MINNWQKVFSYYPGRLVLNLIAKTKKHQLCAAGWQRPIRPNTAIQLFDVFTVNVPNTYTSFRLTW